MNPHDLMRVDVSSFIEKKNGLSYLSWAHAWAQALKHDPAANFNVESWTDDVGNTRCWMEVNGTAMVWVTVTMFGQPRTCMLPVMNSKNEPISIEGRKFKDKYGNEKVEKLDAFNVNTAIMRCMTKALAMHGLGLNVYAGEDLPLDVGLDTKEEPPKETALPPKKDAQPPNEAVEEPPKVNDDGTDPRGNAELFAEAMVEYVTICTSEAGLRSYWKANQTKIDDLKSNHPDLFTRVRDVFSEMKAKFKEKA